jgi:hypothetical protein
MSQNRRLAAILAADVAGYSRLTRSQGAPWPHRWQEGIVFRQKID